MKIAISTDDTGMVYIKSFAPHIALFLAATCLQGCPSMKAWTFKAAPESGQRAGTVRLAVYSAKQDESTYFENAKKAYPGLDSALKKCAASGAESAALIVPVIGKYIFDRVVDKTASKLKEISDSSTKSYSAQFNVNSNDFTGAVTKNHCLVLTREAEGGDIVFVSVLKLQTVPEKILPKSKAEAFNFLPTFVAMKSAAAVTAASETPTITATFAITVSGIGQQDNGLPAFALIGAATAVVPEVPIGIPGLGKASCEARDCRTSNPVPLDTRGPRYTGWIKPDGDILYSPRLNTVPAPAPASIPLNENTVLNIGVSVVETGDVGEPFDEAKDESAAIKAAFGPVISDLLKEKYE